MRNESTEHCATFFMPTACRAGTTSQRPGGETAGGARRDVAGRLGSVAKTRGITAVYECRLAVRRIASHHLTSARSHLPSDANRVRGEARGIPDHHWQRCPVPTPHARPLTARNTCQLSGHKFTLKQHVAAGGGVVSAFHVVLADPSSLPEAVHGDLASRCSWIRRRVARLS
jgi:hypothetical protein